VQSYHYHENNEQSVSLCVPTEEQINGTYTVNQRIYGYVKYIGLYKKLIRK